MNTVFPSSLTSNEINNINLFGKKYEFRVLLWRNVAASHELDQTNRYNTSSGEYTFEWIDQYNNNPSPVWIKSLTYTQSSAVTYPVHRMEYMDENGNFILLKEWYSKVTSSSLVIIDNPVFASTYRIRSYSESNLSSWIVMNSVTFYSDTFFDITKYVSSIDIDQNASAFISDFDIPYTSLGLINSNGMWNKNTDASLIPYCDRRNTDGTWQWISYAATNIKTYKVQGSRITIEIKFLGDNFEESNFIILSCFNARNWKGNSVSGESGWTAKVKIDTPLIEGMAVDDIIENYIVKKEDGTLLLQLNKDRKKEIVTVVNEIVGDATLNPENPVRLIEGSQVLSHCSDGTFTYYAIRGSTDHADTSPGVGIDIWRGMIGGVQEFLGTIRPKYPTTITWGGYNYSFWSILYNQHSSFYGGNVSRYVAHIFQMSVDQEYLYIPCVHYMYGDYRAAGGSPVQWLCEITDSVLYKLPKNGAWGNIFSTSAESSLLSGSYPLTASSTYNLSLGSNCYAISTALNIQASAFAGWPVPDPLESGNSILAWMGCELINDGGTEKLLVMKKLKDRANITTSPLTGFIKINKNFSSATQIGTSGGRELVLCAKKMGDSISDTSLFCSYYDEQYLINYLSMIDIIGSTYVLQNTMHADLGKRIMSLTRQSDGLYGSGQGYQFDAEFSLPSTESPYGIVQLYNTVFNINACNICHISDPYNNEYVSYPVPEITSGADRLDNNYIRYGSYSYKDGIYSTLGFKLNTKTGELVLRDIIPSSSPKQIRASYDFVNSIKFYESNEKSRLSNNVIGKLQETTDKIYFINEYGALSNLPSLKSQAISMKSVSNEYLTTFPSDEVTNPESEQFFRITEVGVQLNSVSAIEFCPLHTGILNSVSIAFALRNMPPNAIKTNFSVKLGISNNNTDNVFLTRDTGTSKPILPPVTANITEILSSTMVFHNAAKLYSRTGGYNQSEYYWNKFDVSAANFTVSKGQHYSILIMQAAEVNTGNYFGILAKKALTESPISGYCDAGAYEYNEGFLNKGCYQLINDTAWTSLVSGNWYCGCGDGLGATYDSVPMMEINIRKKIQTLDAVNMIDPTNKNITGDYNSLMFGSNTALVVRNTDFTTTYTRNTHYTISNIGGEFTLNFPAGTGTLTINDNIVAQWLESKHDLLSIIDSRYKNKTSLLTESSSFGDDTRYLRTTINGLVLMPSSISTGINRRFDMFPGMSKLIEATVQESKKIESVGMYKWDDQQNKFIAVDDDFSSESKNFVVEFSDPMLVGTTKYIVREGKWKSTDTLNIGSKSGTSKDVPYFFRVTLSSALDLPYNIMIKPEHCVEWRVATDADWNDMTVSSNAYCDYPPTDPTNIKTSTQFYLKHMNKRYGFNTCDYVAYNVHDIVFFVDDNGTVIEDQSFNNNDQRNPISTSYSDKRIFVRLSPVDIYGNPLLRYHKYVSQTNGYSSEAYTGIMPWMSGNIQRADINNYGVNAIYNNYDMVNKKFLDIEVVGYILNNITNIMCDIKNPGYTHADASTITITNEFMQNIPQLELRTRTINAFWNLNRIEYSASSTYDPRLRPGTIVRITSERENLNNALFIILKPKHSMSNSQLITNLGDMLQL